MRSRSAAVVFWLAAIFPSILSQVGMVEDLIKRYLIIFVAWNENWTGTYSEKLKQKFQNKTNLYYEF